jgi:hypothetical protein
VTAESVDVTNTNAANTTIEVTGGPLNVNPVATPGSICRGDTTRLHAAAGGGNVGFYEYTWSSNPPGFSSTESEPFVHPLGNTTYMVTVTDQFNTMQGSTLVSIYPEPVIRLGPADTTVCIYDTVLLDAQNPGSTYLWSNGEITRTIRFVTTGIGADAQDYSVEVVNENGCKSSDSISVFFSFDVCTGVNDKFLDDRIHIYPNPSKGIINVEINGLSGKTEVSVLTTLGKVIRSFDMPLPSSGNASVDVDLSGTPKGVYLMRFSNSSFIHVKKLFVE